MPDKVPVILDTDIGSDIDDAVCLAYLLAEERCDLLGVSAVSGEAPRRAMLADAVCRAAGRRGVPVWSGAEAPLIIPQKQPAAAQAEVLSRWEHCADVAHNEAVVMLRRAIRERPGEVTLLTIGPLTNAGLLFALDREVPRLLKRMVVMGGSFFEPGRLEWNIICDPHAAAIVFASDVPEIQVHGLDVTCQCRMDAQECRRRLRGGPLDVVADMAEVWFRKAGAITFHDPLAGCCVFEPGLCSYRRGRVSVDLTQGKEPGLTTIGEGQGGAHLVAEHVDVDGFFRHYFGTVERANAK